jgi:thiamine phosphate synthase YjbQ (UPF0047 family)
MKKISSLLWQSISKAGIEKEMKSALVIEEFKKNLVAEFGEKILKKVKILHFKNGILSISVLSSVVAQEIKLNEKRLIEKINRKFNKKIVERISFFS